VQVIGFIIMSADGWEREQKTLYILQNTSLMQQIAESLSSYKINKGYSPLPSNR